MNATPLARDLLQPAVCLDEYATVAEAAEAVGSGHGCFVRGALRWWSVAPRALAGAPSQRRVIDVPIDEVEPLPLLHPVSEATFAQGECRPVFDAEGSCRGQVTRSGLLHYQGEVASLIDLRASLASVAHDMNNLLLVAELAAADGDDPQRVQASLQELALLVRRLSTLHRSHSNEARDLALHPFLEATAAQLSEVAGLTVSVAPTSSTVHCAPAPLRRILLNLCLNAADAGATHVHISPRRRAHEVVLEVVDDGPGFDDAALARAFEPGFSTSGGTGLGLPSVRRIAERFGGSVSVHPRTGGGQIDVTVPVASR